MPQWMSHLSRCTSSRASSPWQHLLLRLLTNAFLTLYCMSRCALCFKRPSRRHLPHLWRGSPRRISGVPLPLAVLSMGRPRRPRPGVLARGVRLNAELRLQLSYILDRGRWCTRALPPRFLRAPSLRVGLHVVLAAGGLCPLAQRERVGDESALHPFAWATASDNIHADHSWAAAAVHSPI